LRDLRSEGRRFFRARGLFDFQSFGGLERMRVNYRIVVSTWALLAVGSASCFASGGASMGGGSMGGGASFTPRSPHDQAVDLYNQGVREVGKAKDHGIDADKASGDDKKAKALQKAQKSYATALQEFQRAVDKDPSLFQAWNYVGFCQRHLGRYEEALSAYGKALDLQPRYGEAYEYRAEAYLGLNRLEEAKASYMQLFATARPLADELMNSMHRWVQERQSDAKGVNAEDLAAFAKWVDERAAIAQQTASLWLGPANKKQIDWN
jgi:tetratricopeptide (TPR) repeat protein